MMFAVRIGIAVNDLFLKTFCLTCFSGLWIFKYILIEYFGQIMAELFKIRWQISIIKRSQLQPPSQNFVWVSQIREN